MAYLNVMCSKSVLLFLFMMAALIALGHCKPYQSTTSRNNNYYSGRSLSTTSKPVISLAKTIPPVSRPSTSSNSANSTYSVIIAPRNCPEGHQFDHNNECVPAFFQKIDPKKPQLGNTNQRFSSTSRPISTTSNSGIRLHSNNQNTVNTRRY